MRELTYGAAVNAALDRALSDFPSALVYGEDVAKQGGIFGLTRKLANRHGGDRVFDTPISEAAILGSAVGASMVGKRPVVEIMWMDFTLVALDQIVNQAANVRYASNGTMTAPLTIRTQQGAQPGSCAQHSQNLEAFFAHVPGLRVGLPATPQDAFSMLLAAVASDDPTLIVENRTLYFGDRSPVDTEAPVEVIGGSRTLRRGDDLTIVSWSAMIHRALEAAEMLAEAGVSAEVVDLRWLNPLDIDPVLESVERTGRLLVVHEANLTGGFGAEISARVTDRAFGRLVAAPRRLAVPDSRIPAAPALQAALIPDPTAIAAEATKLVRT